MNLLIFFIIGLPVLEIFLMIKIGSIIGALNTVLLIIFTAISGVYCAKLQGLSTLKSGITQLIKNEMPFYEIVSGATLAFAALLLIFPGFITDFLGFLLIIPLTRKVIITNILSKFYKNKKNNKYIDAECEEIEED